MQQRGFLIVVCVVFTFIKQCIGCTCTPHPTTFGPFVPVNPGTAIGTLVSVDPTELVKVHNDMRNSLLNSADVQCVNWNNDLANLAAQRAVQCSSIKSQPGSRLVPGFTSVGENVLTTQPGQTFNLTDAVVEWFFELSTCVGNTDPTCQDDYKQISNAGTPQIGCARANCPQIQGLPQGGVVFVCEYGVAANLNAAQTFTSGQHCTQCPANAPQCLSIRWQNLCCSQTQGIFGQQANVPVTGAGGRSFPAARAHASQAQRQLTPNFVNNYGINANSRTRLSNVADSLCLNWNQQLSHLALLKASQCSAASLSAPPQPFGGSGEVVYIVPPAGEFSLVTGVKSWLLEHVPCLATSSDPTCISKRNELLQSRPTDIGCAMVNCDHIFGLGHEAAVVVCNYATGLSFGSGAQCNNCLLTSSGVACGSNHNWNGRCCFA